MDTESTTSFLGAAVMPHGSLILDVQQAEQDGITGTSELHKACVDLAEKLVKSRPSLIILISPHGVQLDSTVGVMVAHKGEGNAGWKKHWENVCTFLLELSSILLLFRSSFCHSASSLSLLLLFFF